MYPPSTTKLAQQIIRGHRTKIRDADNLVKKPRIAEVHAISANVINNRARATSSLNDILETYGATALLQDPELKLKLRNIASSLNTPLF